jgi:hypothetical protein
MFHMMNEARIGVGLAPRCWAWPATRPRSTTPAAPAGPAGRASGQGPRAAAHCHHRTRRRQAHAAGAEVLCEGALALELYCARWSTSSTPATRRRRAEAALLLEVLTPIAKSWPSEWCLEANSLAIQVHGGYGYTRDFPVEQYWRDNRLNMIHEGTHGIQALDLLGRKVVMDGGAGLKLLATRISRPSSEPGRSGPGRSMPTNWPPRCRRWARPPRPPGPPACRKRRWPTPRLTCRPSATWCWPGSGWTWPSRRRRDDTPVNQGKLAATRFFFAYELPKIDAWLGVVSRREAVCRDMRDEWF